jgi:hypothetical protein
VLTVLVLTPFLLPALPRWRERLPVMAGCGVLAVVASAASEILAARGGLLPGIPFPDRPFMEAHVTGSQSNVNLLADLLVLLLPWCLCGIATASGWRRWWAGVAAAAALTMIVLTQSRAALLGLAAGAGVAVVATLAAATRLGLSRDRRLGVLAAVVAAGGALAGFLVLAPDDVGFARRLRSIVVDPPPAAGVPFRAGLL